MAWRCPHTHRHCQSYCSELQRDSPLVPRGQRISVFSRRFVFSLVPRSLCVLQGSTLSAFKLFLYLLDSWIQQVSDRLYSVPGTVQGPKVGKMNKTRPCPLFWEISAGSLICRSWKYCWQFLLLSLTYSQSNMWQNVGTWKYLMNECMRAKFLSRVQLFVTPWTVARQALLPMEILQARILEWVAMGLFRESSQPRDWTRVLYH